MDRALRANVLTNGKAVETGGDIDVLLLIKTGTITIGNRKATKAHAAPQVAHEHLMKAAALSSKYDETPEGKSIVELAGLNLTNPKEEAEIFIKFTAETRCSGLDIGNVRIRKGATDAIKKIVRMPAIHFQLKP